MSVSWHIVWCPHPHCQRFGFSTGSPEEDAAALETHRADCEGLGWERGIAADDERMRLEGRWQRVVRRWGLPEEYP